MATSDTRKHRSPPRTVEEALDQFWRARSIPGHVPDYVGFKSWIGEKLDAARSAAPLPIHMQTSRTSEIELILQLVAAAKASGIEITKSGPVHDPSQFGKSDGKRSTIKCFNRGKLLLSFFNDLPERQRNLYCLFAYNTEQFEAAAAVRQDSSQSEHRAAFFRAVATGDGHAAFKMLGRLREEEHDLGELEFLEATAFFHANRLTDAIRHARNVPKDSIDWRRAFMLILESHALQGDIQSISNDLRGEPDFVFPPFFLRYICQVAVYNSPDPEASLERAATIIKNDSGQSQSGLGVFQTWNRYTCQLAVQFVEQQRELSLRLSAIEQGGASGEAEEAVTNRPLRTRQVECALVLDPDLVEKMSKCELDDACAEIVKRLVNWERPGQEDFINAFVTQWRIGDRSVFLNNVLSNLELLASAPNNEILQLIGWAYQEACVLGRGQDAKRLERLLLGSEAGANWVNKATALSGSDRLERQLSAMGKLALRSAKWDLAHAENGSSIWRDAGMVSLGFFRILELEINEWLILPMIGSIDLQAFEREFERMRDEQQGQLEKKTIEFWQRMIPLLRKVKDAHKGLELGALEGLFQKVRTIAGSDSRLKAVIHSAIVFNLSPSGIEAFKSGELGRLLASSAREKFRNPAAHTRYISIDTARECKGYVEGALEKLIQYSKRSSADGQTLH